MKKIISTIAIVSAFSALTAFAQQPSPTPAGSPPAKHERKHDGPRMEGPMREALDSLAPAERQQLMEAHKKAEQDPAVIAAHEAAKAAHKEMRDAMRAAMLKADPTIGPVLDKLDAAMKAERPPHLGKNK